ncbi:MAG: hypothetical protein KDA87_19245 [Planctomycetales bacterium]|nr:hypothetical protein [Planctomycetales bacterium]
MGLATQVMLAVSYQTRSTMSTTRVQKIRPERALAYQIYFYQDEILRLDF